ncbi:MAG: hypothetical protein HY270_12220 [Deltaproteobacteria bacterium]|nr:hypothetical protein [Deltaproteobacteria bacterium]
MDRDDVGLESDGSTTVAVESTPPLVDSVPRTGRCGRPPGINPERRELLAAFAEQGLTLGEMAAVLGVSRQCIHAQLKKCSGLQQTRKSKLTARRDRNRSRRSHERALRDLKDRGEWQLVHFLQEAETHGWVINLEPDSRVRINGVPLAFHRPRRLHGNRRRTHGTRYYHLQITRPEWFHVVCLPDGRYTFYLPDPQRHCGTYYIRSTAESQPWPSWPNEMDLQRLRTRPRVEKRSKVQTHRHAA